MCTEWIVFSVKTYTVCFKGLTNSLAVLPELATTAASLYSNFHSSKSLSLHCISASHPPYLKICLFPSKWWAKFWTHKIMREFQVTWIRVPAFRHQLSSMDCYTVTLTYRLAVNTLSIMSQPYCLYRLCNLKPLNQLQCLFSVANGEAMVIRQVEGDGD